ncbi:MAG: hypothetical protein ABUT39_05475 [Acidobacteriota bacterium]
MTRRSTLAFLLLAASALGPAAAQPLYPNGRTFNCDFQAPNGNGKAVLSFNITGSLGKQQGSMVEQIVGGQTVTRTIELTSPRWSGNKKLWSYRQGNGTTCTVSTWAYSLSFDGCSDGKRQLCRENTVTAQQVSSADARLPFVSIKEIWLEDDREGDVWPFDNDAEVEIYIARGENSTYKASRSASAVFTGYTYPPPGWKPDINDAGKWYRLDPPFPLPLEVGSGILLVEDDYERSVLYASSKLTNGFVCFPNAPTDPSFVASLPGSISSACRTPSFQGNILSELIGNDDVFGGMLILTNGADQGMDDQVVDVGQWRVKLGVGY